MRVPTYDFAKAAKGILMFGTLDFCLDLWILLYATYLSFSLYSPACAGSFDQRKK